MSVWGLAGREKEDVALPASQSQSCTPDHSAVSLLSVTVSLEHTRERGWQGALCSPTGPRPLSEAVLTSNAPSPPARSGPHAYHATGSLVQCYIRAFIETYEAGD